jgi:endoglucanase
MKNILKLFGILVLVLFIGIGFVTCDGNVNNNNNNNNGDDDDPVDDPFNISAVEFVSKMRVGWNLGNTFDATSGGTIDQMESAWAGTVTTRENIEAIKNAGFNLIRIPVSWSKVADAGNNYTILSDWMLRITVIADWAISNDMYVIINTHHDSGDNGVIFRFLDTNVEASLVRFRQVWEQIAENFKWWDEKLIFEPLNEPRTGNDWTGNAENYNNINRHYQVFVDTVRASGENNEKRFLLFNTYAGSRSAAPMNGLVLPTDTATDKLIVSYHAYVPNGFCFDPAFGSTAAWSIDGRGGRDATDITNPMDRFFEKFVEKGIPVIIGEFGAMNKNNAVVRGQWVEFYTKSAKERGMPVVWWDNATTTGDGELFGLLNRRTNQFFYPEVL